jgi:Reverse transcriptase-like
MTVKRQVLEVKKDIKIVEMSVDASVIRKSAPYANVYIAVVIKWHPGMPDVVASAALRGEIATAEWEALKFGLMHARQLGITRVKIKTDCKTVAEQFNGEFKIHKKQVEIQKLADECIVLKNGFAHCEVLWVPREKNKEANLACRKAAGLKHPNR